MEVENKRREILRSLPSGHPRYQNLLPLKLEDVRRSSYWYKKWGITPPRKERAKAAVRMPFRIPKPPPICGDGWLREHLNDHSPEEIGALSIEVNHDGRKLPPVSVADKRGKVKAIMRKG